MIGTMDIDNQVHQLANWNTAAGSSAAQISRWIPDTKYQNVPMSTYGGAVTFALPTDVALVPSAVIGWIGSQSVPTAYSLMAQQVVYQHPLLSDPAVGVFLRANPYADRQAMRLIYEEVASAFTGATLTCTSAADMDTGKWHLYLDVDTHGELDIDAQIQLEMVLHSTFLQNHQLHRAKEYFHVTVS